MSGLLRQNIRTQYLRCFRQNLRIQKQNIRIREILAFYLVFIKKYIQNLIYAYTLVHSLDKTSYDKSLISTSLGLFSPLDHGLALWL